MRPGGAATADGGRHWSAVTPPTGRRLSNRWVEPGSPAWMRRAPVDHLFENKVVRRTAW